jgi:hypothetical protein
VLGRVNGNRLKAVVNGPTASPLFGDNEPRRYTPKAYFVAEVLPEGEGSVVVGGLDLTLTRAFAAVWLGSVGLFGLPVILIWSVTTSLRTGAVSVLAAPIFPLLMMLFFWFVFRTVRRAQDTDAREIEALLSRAVCDEPPTVASPLWSDSEEDVAAGPPNPPPGSSETPRIPR